MMKFEILSFEILARGMLKPVYFAFVKTMLEPFCELHIFVKSRNETRHFDEGGPCGEPPCTSLDQRPRMLMLKDPSSRRYVF